MKYVHPVSHPLLRAEAHLRENDPLLNLGIVEHGVCLLIDGRVSHFHVLVKTIIDQQLSVKVAQSIADKLLAKQGGSEFDAGMILNLSPVGMRECGLSNAKVRYIRGVAEAVTSRKLCFDALEKLEDEKVLEVLMQYHGIGMWTAEVFLMFSLGRLDVLPLGDLVLRNAIRRYYGLDKDAGRDEYVAVAEKWRPYRSVASWYLWVMIEA